MCSLGCWVRICAEERCWTQRGWAGAEERTVGGGGATLESRHSRDRLLLYLIHLVLYWLSTFINIGPILSAS